MLSDGEIVAQVSGEPDEFDSDSESVVNTKATVLHAEAHEAFEWLEAQGTDTAHLLLVKTWMSVAAKKRRDTLQ